ncbi:MAG: hypothetical protein WDW38_001886 [Sanguina aurantia]
METFGPLIYRLPCLSLRQLPCEDLLSVLREFPLLRDFKFLSDPEQPKLNLYCDIDDGERSILHERLTVQQLRLDCDGLHVLGSSRGVRDTLAVLPALPHMRDVKVLFDDSLQDVTIVRETRNTRKEELGCARDELRSREAERLQQEVEMEKIVVHNDELGVEVKRWLHQSTELKRLHADAQEAFIVACQAAGTSLKEALTALSLVPVVSNSPCQPL